MSFCVKKRILSREKKKKVGKKSTRRTRNLSQRTESNRSALIKKKRKKKKKTKQYRGSEQEKPENKVSCIIHQLIDCGFPFSDTNVFLYTAFVFFCRFPLGIPGLNPRFRMAFEIIGGIADRF